MYKNKIMNIQEAKTHLIDAITEEILSICKKRDKLYSIGWVHYITEKDGIFEDYGFTNIIFNKTNRIILVSENKKRPLWNLYLTPLHSIDKYEEILSNLKNPNL